MMTQDRNKYIDQLHQQHFNRLIRIAYRQTGDMEVAKEFVQDVFLQAIEKYETVSTHENPAAWLTVVLSNRTLNYRRLTERRGEVPYDDWLKDVLHYTEDHSLEDLLPAGLSDHEKQILIWRFKEQMDHRTIANMLGISEAASRHRLSRAVKHCSKLLEK